MRRKPIIITIAAAAAVLTGCNNGGDAASQPNVVVTVGKHRLTIEDVQKNIPSGLTEQDSTLLAKTFIRNWINSRLIIDVASDDVDMDEINRLADAYREELIKSRYRRAMAQRIDNSFISDDSIEAFYDNNKADFHLERPLLKGIYLKVPDDSKHLNEIRRLYKSDRQVDIDRLEKAALTEAVHYDYFRDRWVDLEQIETKIPIDFNESVRQKLQQHKPLEISAEGFYYFLHTTDYLPAGSEMPLEAARPIITERLLSQRRRDFDQQLIDDLYKRSLENGTVRFPAQ